MTLFLDFGTRPPLTHWRVVYHGRREIGTGSSATGHKWGTFLSLSPSLPSCDRNVQGWSWMPFVFSIGLAAFTLKCFLDYVFFLKWNISIRYKTKRILLLCLKFYILRQTAKIESLLEVILWRFFFQVHWCSKKRQACLTTPETINMHHS